MKASYDKSCNDLHSIQNTKGKDSGIDDEDSNEPTKQSVDVGAWNKFDLPEPITTCLSELGFSRPTKIQVYSFIFSLIL